jgi:hypothetical protein
MPPEATLALPIGLEPIGKAIRRRFKSTNRATQLRWIRKGLFGPNGQRVKLVAWMHGSRWVTTDAEVERFLSLTIHRAQPDTDPTVTIRSPAERLRAANAAKQELRKLGL